MHKLENRIHYAFKINNLLAYIHPTTKSDAILMHPNNAPISKH